MVKENLSEESEMILFASDDVNDPHGESKDEKQADLSCIYDRYRYICHIKTGL